MAGKKRSTRCLTGLAGKLHDKLKEQGYKCALTGRQLTPDTVHADHIVPLSKGGKHSIGNIWMIHKDVNKTKADLMLEDFIAICCQVARLHGKDNEE